MDLPHTRPGAARITNRAESLAMLAHSAETLAQIASGAVGCLHSLKAEMEARAAGMPDGGTVKNWASVILLVTEALGDKLHEVEMSIADIKALDWAA